MKFVIFKQGMLFLPVMFPEVLSHSQVSLNVREGEKPVTVFAAGFYYDYDSYLRIFEQRATSMDDPEAVFPYRSEGVLSICMKILGKALSGSDSTMAYSEMSLLDEEDVALRDWEEGE